MDKNFSASANSKNPKTTFTLFNHPPDFGSDFKSDGNMANKPKGIANAMENPSIPMAGPNRSPFDAASTNKVPIIGPVHEKETKERLKAIKKRPTNPPLSDLASILLTNELGSVISNAPKKDAAKATNSRKNIKLNIPFVDKALSASDPKRIVMIMPKAT
ncbi:hypothetical protein D3C87_1361240 [compost metagenome]